MIMCKLLFIFRTLPSNYLLCVIIFYLSVSVYHVLSIAPIISRITPTKVVNIGDTFDLECAVQYAQNYPVIWAKINPSDPSEGTFISKDASQTSPDNRFSIRHDRASYTYTLQLSKVRETDSGFYQCQVGISSTNKVTADVNVTVQVPPFILDNSTRTVETVDGSKIQLGCYATGNPKPQITWRRQNNDILPTGSPVYKGNILVIYNVTKEDRGTYYCIANNGVGREAKRNVRLFVEFAPEVIVEQKEYSQAIGYPIELICNVESYPKSEIMWLKDNYRVQDTPSFTINTLTTNDIVTSKLRIESLSRKDFGEYVCVANNKLSMDRKSIYLSQTSTPVCPPACIPLAAGASEHLPVINLLIVAILCQYLLY